MTNHLYKKAKRKNFRKYVRLFGLFLSFTGLIMLGYAFFPLVSWQLFLAPVFASQNLALPIPQNSIIKTDALSIIHDSTVALGVDYSNAKNWFPGYKGEKHVARIPTYTISIPTINIYDANVSTGDLNLTEHLVNYPGTAVPPEKGTPVIFGHSTLPQLYDPLNYKTIFAKLYLLKNGDTILVSAEHKLYKYKVFQMIVVSADDTSVFTQEFDKSYLTLVTCTPPGTTWKRLVIKAQLEV